MFDQIRCVSSLTLVFIFKEKLLQNKPYLSHVCIHRARRKRLFNTHTKWGYKITAIRQPNTWIYNYWILKSDSFNIRNFSFKIRKQKENYFSMAILFEVRQNSTLSQLFQISVKQSIDSYLAKKIFQTNSSTNLHSNSNLI